MDDLNRFDVLKSEVQPTQISDDDNLNLSAEKLVELGKFLNDRFEKMRGYHERAQWESEKAESLKAYYLEPPDKPIPYSGAANLRCIFTRIAADSLHSNHMYSIFGQGNMAKVKPHYLSQDYKHKADKAADYLSYQLAYESDFFSILDDADLKDKKFGMAYLEPHYERQIKYETVKYQEDQEVPVLDDQGNSTGETKKVKRNRTKKEKKVVFDGIKIESISPECIYKSPFIVNFEDAITKDVIFKYSKKTMEEVKQLAEEGEDGESFYIPSQVENLRGLMINKIMDDTSALEQARKQYDGFSLGWYLDQQIVEVVQAYLWYDIDGDKKKEEISVVFEAKTGVVIRVALTPCRIIEIKTRPIDGRGPGESIYKAIRPLCDEWEAIHNARVNAGAWENAVIGFYRAGGRFNPEAVQIVPGHFYPVDDPKEVQFAPTPQVRQSYFQEEGLLLQYVERILGITDNIQGLPASGEQTATESIAMNQRASIRLSNPLNRLVVALEKLLNHMWDLNRLCAPETKEFYVVGIGNGVPLFKTMNREDFSVQTKFKLEIQNIFDQQMLQQTWLMAFKMFRQDPIVMMNPAVSYELFKNTIAGMGINLTIPKPPQAMALSPVEVIELIEDGKDYNPMPGADFDEHLERYKEFMETEEYEDWDFQKKQKLALMIKKFQMLKGAIEKFQLNKSGLFDPGPNLQGQSPLPGMTMTKNPSQTFNTLRAGESGPSMQQQPQNGMRGSMMGGANQ